MSAAAGYSGKPVWQKLGLKPGQRVRVVDPPRDYGGLIGAPGHPFAAAPDADIDLLHLFARNRDALVAQLPAWLPCMAAGGMVWVSWPKKSSALFVDLTEDGVREVCLPLGWVDVKVCAIDADWSGLKLLRRRAR